MILNKKYTIFVLSSLFALFITYKFTNNNQLSDSLLSKEVIEEANKNLPMKVSENLRYDLLFRENKILHYKYTFTNYTAQTIEINTMIQTFEDKTKQSICINPQTKVLLKNLITLEYDFYDKNNFFVNKIKIEPSYCNY
jgi:hypothetical protein